MLHFAALVSSLVFSFSTHAQSSFRGAVSSALGGSGVAGLPAAEGALLNPALIAIFSGSGLDANYRDGSLGAGAHRQALALGAIDNGGEQLFSGALHYVRTRDTGRVARPVDGELWHGAVAGRVNERLAVGASLYRLGYREDHESPKSQMQWNYGFGALAMFTRSFGVGYAIRNLALPGGNVPAGLREDLYHALGTYVGLGEAARLRVDLGRRERRNPDRQLAYMVGLETRTADMVLLRFGFRHDEAGDGRVWTAGLSFDGPRLKVDYAFEKSQDAGHGALHSVDLRVPF